MHYLFADETNTSPKHDERVKFFVYGGLIVPEAKFSHLDREVTRLRAENNYLSTDSLKFDTRSKPNHVSAAQFANVKNAIVEMCIEAECRLVLYIVLHDIADTTGIPTTIKWGADHIFEVFNRYLSENESDGIAFLDRLPATAEYNLLVEKFTKGNTYKNEVRPLSRIRMFASSCDNASHLNSVADIVIGTFRYCINQPINADAAKRMMKNLVKIIWAVQAGEHLDPYEKGLTLRPVQWTIKIPAYKAEYTTLINHINSLLE